MHTPFPSLARFAECPSCGGWARPVAGARWRCRGCGHRGAFLAARPSPR